MKKILYSIMVLAIAAFSFSSCEDVPMPYPMPGEGGGNGNTEEIIPEGDGTQAAPYNVAAILQETADLASGSSLPSKVYIKGIVTTVKECSASYGNATFYIADASSSNKTFYVYRCSGIDNGKVSSDDLIQVGDEVVVYGTVTNYNGTIETAQKEAYLVSIVRNGETVAGTTTNPNQPETQGDAKGDGTQAAPYNVAGVINYTTSLGADVNSDKEVYFKGYITSFKSGEEPGNNYGNATFYISDDKAGSNKFCVYRALSYNKGKFTSSSDLAVGDEVVICGKVVNFRGNTPETVTGEAYLVSRNGSTEGGSSSGGSPTDNPSGGSTTPGGSSEGITYDGTKVTITNAGVEAGTEQVTLVVNDLGLADKAAASGTYNLSDGSTLTIAQGTGATPATYYSATNGFRIYASNTLTFDCKKKIANIVFECDSYNGTDYVGNKTATISFTEKGATYCNYIAENKGGVQLRVQKIIITYAK